MFHCCKATQHLIHMDDRSSELGGKVSETELPDGTVCEFFTFEEKNGETLSSSTRSPNSSERGSYSDGEGRTCDPDVTDDDRGIFNSSTAAVRKRKASEDPLAQLDGLKPLRETQVNEEPAKRLRKVVDIFDFEGVVEALEEGRICLPGPSWSHSLLNRSVLLFLCWDEGLRLTKKAVLRKGSPLELFCDDRLLASRAELLVRNYTELELALNYLDKYEWCMGLDTGGTSSECELYTLSGKSRCAPCDNVVAVLQNDVLDGHTFDEVITEITEIVMEGD